MLGNPHRYFLDLSDKQIMFLGTRRYVGIYTNQNNNKIHEESPQIKIFNLKPYFLNINMKYKYI